MDLDDNADDSNGREKTLTGIRLFKDQIENLKWLAIHKYRNNRRPADLIREAIDRFIDSEKSALK
jgi:predicted DNA-binding protein